MTAPPAIVQTLPFAAWILLATAAIGTAVFVVLTAERTDATTGYLRTTALIAAILAALAWALDGSLPRPADVHVQAAPAELDRLRAACLAAFAVLITAYAVLIRRPRARLALAAATGVASVSTLVAAAFGWAPIATDAVPFALQLGILAVVTGGSLAAIALGHWYLVTPKLSVRPLVGQIHLLLGALVLQVLLFVVWTTLGGGVAQPAWSALSGPSALLVWLRGAITLIFPVVLVYMALRTAQTRSMESSTGLLYINLAAVLAGTIGAGAMYVSDGILV